MRRPKGEGSVTKLSTGKYRARIELDPMNGKRKWLSVIRDTPLKHVKHLGNF